MYVIIEVIIEVIIDKFRRESTTSCLKTPS